MVGVLEIGESGSGSLYAQYSAYIPSSRVAKSSACRLYLSVSSRIRYFDRAICPSGLPHVTTPMLDPRFTGRARSYRIGLKRHHY